MPRKPRKLFASADSCDTDLLEKPILRILRRHKVPKEWLEPPVVHILTVVALSGFPEAQFLDTPSDRTRSFLEKLTPKQRQAWAQRREKRKPLLDMVRIYRSQERAMLGLMAKLSAEDPPKFFQVLAAISKYIHQRLDSPRFRAARQLWYWGVFRPEMLDNKRSELALDIMRLSDRFLSQFIPTESELAIKPTKEQMDVSTKVVEHALKTLQTAGLLRPKPFPPRRVKFMG